VSGLEKKKRATNIIIITTNTNTNTIGAVAQGKGLDLRYDNGSYLFGITDEARRSILSWGEFG